MSTRESPSANLQQLRKSRCAKPDEPISAYEPTSCFRRQHRSMLASTALTCERRKRHGQLSCMGISTGFHARASFLVSICRSPVSRPLSSTEP
eukprot:6212263-Pleurochrysis_carterae.AAC.4